MSGNNVSIIYSTHYINEAILWTGSNVADSTTEEVRYSLDG